MKEIPLPRVEDPTQSLTSRYPKMGLKSPLDTGLGAFEGLNPKELFAVPAGWPRVGEWEEFAKVLDNPPPVG